MNILLALGCHGLEDDGFVQCNGVCNNVLNISKLDKNTYDKVTNFLDNAADLFNNPCIEHNKCVNIITFLYRDYKVISERDLYKIQLFIKNHKQCGIFIMLVPEE